MAEDFRSFYQDILKRELDGQLPEDLLEHYEIKSCLAHEEFNEIYLLSRRGDGQKAVLRISNQGLREDGTTEYEILKKLNHPCVPKALEAYAANGKSYLLREYIEGQTLKQYVQAHGALGQDELIDIAVELCDILTYLHRQRPPVIHRDIKPENIVIDADGHAKLIDFGIARAFRENATSDTIAIGTRHYMAPEQFGGAQTDARTDLYALGVVMIYIGTVASDRTNLRHRYPHRGLLPIIGRCIQADPEKRYQNSISLRRALLSVQHSVRRKVLRGIGAATLGIALAGSGLLYGQRQGYDAGFLEGKSQGYQAGNSSGFALGYDEGYSQGQSDERLLANEARSLGMDMYASQVFSQETQRRGNTAGNAINKSLCATDGAFVYYALHDRIEKMDMEGENVSVFCSVSAENLNIWDDRLYFTANDGIYQAPLDGSTPEIISSARFGDMDIVDNIIYGTDSMDLLRLNAMDLDGSSQRRLSERGKMYYLNIHDGYAYFSDPLHEDRLTRMSLDSGKIEPFDIVNAFWINVIGDKAFYTYYGDTSTLSYIPAEGGDSTLLTATSAAYTNITPYGLFFANGLDHNRLYRLSLSGTSQVKLTDDSVSYINVAGQWVFYQNKDDGNALYRIRVDGTRNQKIGP